MTTYVAFLRGINGGVSVKMNIVKDLFENLGFLHVQTVLATGNVIFETTDADIAKMEQRIEQAITTALHYDSSAILWTCDELRSFVASEPFKGIVTTRAAVPQVTLLKNVSKPRPDYPPSGKGYRIVSTSSRVICSLLDLSGATSSDLLQKLDKTFGTAITTRNWNTIEKVLARMTAPRKL